MYDYVIVESLELEYASFPNLKLKVHSSTSGQLMDIFIRYIIY